MDEGQMLGKYRILSSLGGGGMADVYLAIDPNGAKIVLKIPRQEFASDNDFVARLKAEKEALSRLNHPCIAVFKDFHEDWDPPVLAMEYVEGETLAQLLTDQSGPLGITRSCNILTQIAEALSYCHKAGVTHRDVKPANILIAGGDHVKVADFGIAKLKDAASLTRRTVIVGSALVMAPEQWLQQSITHRVDIYALGVLAYRMLTGQYPFEGDVDTLRQAHCYRHPVSPRSLNPDLPPLLSDLVMECLNKDPTRRLSSADEFLLRLGKIRPALDFYERYRFEEEIGRGAMGVVYRATRRDDGMTVAIKTLDHRLTDEGLLQRQRTEGSVLARLNHPFICRLIETRESFLVMQYVRGETLSEYIRRTRGIPVPEALQYFRDILQAVAAAHAENIIHRDLKPSNIMIKDDLIEKHAIVMDFGIAKLLGSSAMTRTTEGLGAAPYKAPELWKKKTADPRSDIYALGIILHEMLTNSLPFHGADPAEYEKQHLSARPASLPPRLRDSYPALNELILRCLEKDPARRFSSVEQVYRGLANIGPAPREDTTDFVSPPPSRLGTKAANDRPRPVVSHAKRRWYLWVVPVVSVLGAVAVYLSLGKTSNNPLKVSKSAAQESPAATGKDSVSAGQAANHQVGESQPYLLPPTLTMQTTFDAQRGIPLRFPVTVGLSASDDSVLRFSVSPSRGVKVRSIDSKTFEVTFTPFKGCLSPYAVTLEAVSRGGRATGTITINVAEPPGRKISLTCSPASRILIDGRAVTGVRVSAFDTTLGSEVRELVVMNPQYPLFRVPIEPGQNPFQRTVDLNRAFAGAETTEVRMNTVGVHMSSDPIPILLNGESFPCEPKERCLLLAGEYMIRAISETPEVDSIKFNGELISKASAVLRLKSASEGLKFNTLLIFLH